MKRLSYCLPFLFVLGCQHRPVEELVLADVAVKAAQKAKADALATDAYRKAENHYLRAKRDYNEGYYDSARKFASQARLLAEQAEFKALQKQVQLRGRPEGSAAPEDLEDAFGSEAGK